MRERRHSPKGRASLMREWLRLMVAEGVDPVAEAAALRATAAWRTLPARIANTIGKRRGDYDFSHEVKEAMDGCLACKACAGQCPIKVDVPSFRAKFFELYHGRYLRPARTGWSPRSSNSCPRRRGCPSSTIWRSAAPRAGS